MFRVDRRTEEFVLFEQHDVTEHQSLGVAANYRQKLKDGMLGHCYRQQSVLVAARVIPRRTGEPAPFDFIQTAKSQRSAMTVPLFLNGRIELVLDLESSQENAFAGPDKQAAEALAADCEQIFAVRWHEAIDHALMDAIEQAAVIVDPAGVIRKLNAAARAIVGHALDVPLCEFAATPQDRDMLQDPRPREPSSVSLRLPGTDVRIPTLASQRSLNDDYEHRMWLFTNLREQRWERDWRYLDQTVSEVARHTRAPLLIADGLLRGAAGLLRKPGFAEKSAELLDRAATQLSKADLTFERLSELADGAPGSGGTPQPVRCAGAVAPVDGIAAGGRCRCGRTQPAGTHGVRDRGLAGPAGLRLPLAVGLPAAIARGRARGGDRGVRRFGRTADGVHAAAGRGTRLPLA